MRSNFIYKKLDWFIPLQEMIKDYEQLRVLATQAGDIHKNKHNEIIDITFIDENNLRYASVRYAGSSTERAVDSYKSNNKIKKEKRLSVKKITNPLDDDRNHNSLKFWAQNSFCYHWLASKGRVTKVTFATLYERSWWPAHFDFSSNHATKINICLTTSSDSVSLALCPRSKELVAVSPQAGDVYLINPSLKHTAFNWGIEPRTFLLATFDEIGKDW